MAYKNKYVSEMFYILILIYIRLFLFMLVKYMYTFNAILGLNKNYIIF